MVVEEINSSNFKEKIKEGRCAVKYEADWCFPCKQLAPIFEELSNEMDNLNFFKLNVDESGDIAQSYGVRGIPTLIVFKNGEETNRIVGVKSKEDLKKELQ